MDHLLRLAIAHDLDPITAVQMATVNIAEAYGLDDRGVIVPGRRADLVVVSDLDNFRAERVYVAGEEIARYGRPSESWGCVDAGSWSVVRPLRVNVENLDLRVADTGGDVRVIGLVPGQIVTEALVERMPVRDAELTADPARGIAKLAVIERHRGTGNIGLGFLKGFGSMEGALASTIAHDHHNLIVVGSDDESMRTAIRKLVGIGGGVAVARGAEILEVLPLPRAGLISDRPLDEVRERLDRLSVAVLSCGCTHPDPVMALSFVALEVIPSLKLTDRGLVDVETFDFVPLEVEG